VPAVVDCTSQLCRSTDTSLVGCGSSMLYQRVVAAAAFAAAAAAAAAAVPAGCPLWPPSATDQGLTSSDRPAALSVFSELTVDEYNAGEQGGMRLFGGVWGQQTLGGGVTSMDHRWCELRVSSSDRSA
jgi:hypothetical protein